ncbi:ABC transporter ATP-binding protein [Paraburkholderia sp. CNPSo 3076]|uniref:ABC transporter ATP-binding protein n=1 Tax=Paraburkholderia sp. CNPSo 3076 TaxID=2940936 RepID=UPI002257E660|nr:ABC transporter ATP-binding protein [Paraburkholderia sp. CNPSo 3076]MCX5542132.1 ABC transporter ATP-binding protein [Paraburkholderia sp. CNPSo 3076]
MRTALELTNLQAWYGESHILHGVNLSVGEGEVVTLLGRNGSGRTTTLRAIMGLTTSRSGSVKIDGREVIGMSTYRTARLGVGYCPEERGIFSGLTTEENLKLPPLIPRAGKGMPMSEIYGMFPNLAERRETPGTRLSGGEQQMLAVARIVRTGAKLLLLDEISEGLAPVIVQALAELVRDLKGRGYTILLVEQNFEFASRLADRLYVMEHGRIIDGFPASSVDVRRSDLREKLGI